MSSDQAIDPDKMALGEEIRKLKAEKDQAYWERNQLIVFLSKRFYAHLQKHDADDKDWDADWRNIVCIHMTSGITRASELKQVSEKQFVKDETLRESQFTWHIHDSDMRYFKHLKQKPNHWDGHTTKEKYERLANIT